MQHTTVPEALQGNLAVVLNQEFGYLFDLKVDVYREAYRFAEWANRLKSSKDINEIILALIERAQQHPPSDMPFVMGLPSFQGVSLKPDGNFGYVANHVLLWLLRDDLTELKECDFGD